MRRWAQSFVVAFSVIVFVSTPSHAKHYAAYVISFEPGAGTDHTTGDDALDTCDNARLSLGDSGIVALGFNTPAFNGPGSDIHITEFGNDEGYTVLGSQDSGATWPFNFGSFTGIADISLDTSIAWINAVKIMDDNVPGGAPPPDSGADIDCVWAEHSERKITSVTFLENLEANPNAGGGVRLFAEADTVGGTAHDTVTVVIQINTPESVTIYVRSYDVDDPSTNNLDLDTNGSAHDDNIGSPRKGAFTNNLDSISVTTDDLGRVEVVFRTTRQPGDNFRVAASLVNDTNTLPDVYNGNTIQSSRRTSMLTVWRTLHLELDAMDAYSASINEFDGTVTARLSPNVMEVDLLPDEWNRFDTGTITIDGIDYTTTSNSSNSSGSDTIATSQSLPGSVVGKSFHLVDDDSTFGNIPLRFPDISLTDTAFAAAYVVVVWVPEWSDTNIPFDNNITDPQVDPTEFNSVTEDKQNIIGDANYWVCLIATGFQDKIDSDADPKIQGGIGGRTHPPVFGGGTDNRIIWYIEVIREDATSPAILEKRTIPHEIGHVFGAEHGDGGLMAGTPTSDSFNAVTLRRIRSAINP